MWSRILTCATGLGLCWLPALAAAESGLQSGARTASVSAIARVDFKIVIPSVLALTVVDVAEPGARGATLRVTSNGRQVSMSSGPATPTPSPTLTVAAASADTFSGRVGAAVLRAPRRGVIEQYAECAVGHPREVGAARRPGGSAVVELAPLLCTASTP